MKNIFILFFLGLSLSPVSAQFSVEDSMLIRSVYDEALENGEAYGNLKFLCKTIGPRLSGSENEKRAVFWIKELLQEMDFDTVWLQDVMVEHWERGKKERCVVHRGNSDIYIPVSVCALGRSVGTDGYLSAPVVEVSSLEDLKSRKNEEIEGKIVFINEPMDEKYIETFRAYSKAGKIRYYGASDAAEKGAVAVVVRSLSTKYDDAPHTGGMAYKDTTNKIPAAAISIKGAKLLHDMLDDGGVDMTLKMDCKTLPDVKSYNVIAEIKGSKYPDEIILVGGHLDSWDLGEGAHDDGAGIMQSIEVLRIMKKLNIRPEHTIRCVLFANEEYGLRGGKQYAKMVKETGEKHLYAIESDAGGFTPRGFSFQVDPEKIEAIKNWENIFAPYLADRFIIGHGGADIGPLKASGVTLIGYRPDTQRYFDLHHSANDVFEEVSRRELHLGAATMTALIYLLDKYGLPEGR